MMNEEIRTIKLGYVNAFLVKSNDKFFLIDTGLSSSYKMLEEILISEGCLPGNLKLIILTHGDQDHFGNCKKLKEKYNVKVAMNKADLPMVEFGEFRKRKIKPLLFKILFFFYHLLRKTEKQKTSSINFKPDIFLSDGQSLKKYGFDAKVIHIPGHTKGSIGILTKNKDFFAGDTLINQKKPETAFIIEDPKELEESIKKIKMLDIKRVFAGHGKPFFMDELFKR